MADGCKCPMDGAPLPYCPVLNEAREDVAGLCAVIESYEREVAVLREGKARYRGLWLAALAQEDEMADNTNQMQGVGYYSYATDLVGEKGNHLSVRVCMDCGGVVAENLRDQHNAWHKRMDKAGAHYHETWDSAEYTGAPIVDVVA